MFSFRVSWKRILYLCVCMCTCKVRQSKKVESLSSKESDLKPFVVRTQSECTTGVLGKDFSRGVSEKRINPVSVFYKVFFFTGIFLFGYLNTQSFRWSFTRRSFRANPSIQFKSFVSVLHWRKVATDEETRKVSRSGLEPLSLSFWASFPTEQRARTRISVYW